MGLAFTEEALEPLTGYSVDFVVKVGGPPGWALEVDGPSHFVLGGAQPRPNGATLLKRRLLERAGWRVATVEYWVWGSCLASGEAAERKHLEALLELGDTGGK